MSVRHSAWGRYPDYRVALKPCRSTGRVTADGQLLAYSKACLLVRESEHDDRLYFPESDVNWALLEPSQQITFCPFKGEAGYWSVKKKQASPDLDNIAWAYQDPFPEVDGLKGYVSFDTEQLAVELLQSWSGDQEHSVATRLPIWGDQQDLVHLLDVKPATENRYGSDPYPNPPRGTIIELQKDKQRRSVVEGGHQLAQAIVAASKTIPEQRVTSASMIFSKAASFDLPMEVHVDVVRAGRSFSTLDVKTVQNNQLRSAGIVLMDNTPADRIRHTMTMPDVAGPDNAVPIDMKVTGREIRVVDGAYTNDLDHIGPPELYAWIRFRDAPDKPYLHCALMTQATTHWTIAAAMRPHAGLSQALAHVSLSTGPLKTDINFHDDVDVSQWMLYVNDAVYAGRGQAQGIGKIFAIDGRLLATYSVHTMIRDFSSPSNSAHNAM